MRRWVINITACGGARQHHEDAQHTQKEKLQMKLCKSRRINSKDLWVANKAKPPAENPWFGSREEVTLRESVARLARGFVRDQPTSVLGISLVKYCKRQSPIDRPWRFISYDLKAFRRGTTLQIENFLKLRSTASRPPQAKWEAIKYSLTVK